MRSEQKPEYTNHLEAGNSIYFGHEESFIELRVLCLQDIFSAHNDSAQVEAALACCFSMFKMPYGNTIDSA